MFIHIDAPLSDAIINVEEISSLSWIRTDSGYAFNFFVNMKNGHTVDIRGLDYGKVIEIKEAIEKCINRAIISV